jgi:hypothetical protein
MAYDPHPGEARRAKKKAMPFLAIPCPVCKAEVGKTCLLPKGHYGFSHDKRRQEWERMKREAESVA